MQLAPIYPLIYKVLKPCFSNCLWSGTEAEPTIALTFDDGPHPRYTSELLEVLDQYGIPASFFLLGHCVNQNPETTRAIYKRGHWLGLHGYDHRAFTRLSAAQLKQTLERTQAEISDACGISTTAVRDVRPPNGFFSPQTLELLHHWNYRPVMWTVVPEDWVHPGVEAVTSRVLKQASNGSIIVLHDGHFGGSDVAETVNQLIPCLQRQGYRFVTIDQLWQTREI